MTKRKLYIIIALLQLMVLSSNVNGQQGDVVYIDAEGTINLAKKNGKDYLWVAIFVPKCANGADIYKRYTELQQTYNDKLDLMILSVVMSNDNRDSLHKFSSDNNFVTPLYVLDTAYAGDNIMRIHIRYMDDMSQRFDLPEQFFTHLILDKNGKLIYRSNEEEMNMTEGILKKYIE